MRKNQQIINNLTPPPVALTSLEEDGDARDSDGSTGYNSSPGAATQVEIQFREFPDFGHVEYYSR